MLWRADLPLLWRSLSFLPGGWTVQSAGEAGYRLCRKTVNSPFFLSMTLDPTVRVEPAGTSSQHRRVTYGSVLMSTHLHHSSNSFLFSPITNNLKCWVNMADAHTRIIQPHLLSSLLPVVSHTYSVEGHHLIPKEGQNGREWHTVHAVYRLWCSLVVTQHNPTHRVTCLQHGPWEEDVRSCFEFFQRFGWLVIYLS